MASGAWAMTSSGGSDGSRRAVAGRQRGAPDRAGLLRVEEDRLPALGELRGHLDVLRAERGQHDRDPVADRVVDQLERLAQAGALVGRQRDRVVAALVGQPLAAPDRTADLDDLPGPADRGVVRHAVPALDDLRPGRAEAEDEPPVGHVVQARGGHRGQRRGAGVQLQDARGDIDPLGLGRDVAELADRVEAVGLGHEHDVQPGLLEVGELGHRLGEPARVVKTHPDAHGHPFSLDPAAPAELARAPGLLKRSM